jgi:hypothetical protein
MRSRTFVALLLTLWAVGIGVGANILWRHETTAGAPSRAPSDWPPGSKIPRAAGKTTVILFGHPACPCTMASLEELARVLTSLPNDAEAFLVIEYPKEEASQFDHSPIEARAKEITKLTIIKDVGGSEVKRFGIQTSGETVVYSPSGTRVFSGGITPGRAHQGENAGSSAVIALLHHQPAQTSTTPVYGCALFTSDEAAGLKERK